MDQPSCQQQERRASPLRPHGEADLLLGQLHQGWRLNSGDWVKQSTEVWLRPSSLVQSRTWLLKDRGADPWLSSAIQLGKATGWSCAIPPLLQRELPQGRGWVCWSCRLWGHQEKVLRGGSRSGEGRVIWDIKQVSLLNSRKQLDVWHPKQQQTPDQRPTSFLWERGGCNKAEGCSKFQPHARAAGSQILLLSAQVPASQDRHIFSFCNCSTALLVSTPSSPQTWASS